MQKFYFLLTLLIFTNFSLEAQLQLANSSEEQIEQFKASTTNPQPPAIVVVAEDIHVLDSTISYAYTDPINGVRNKSVYQYDEDARNTLYNYYRYDYQNLQLFNSYNSTSSFSSDTIFNETEYRIDALSDLLIGNRSWSRNNDAGWSIEYYSDYYDIDTETYKKSFKQIALEWEEDYQLYESSNWVDSIAAYIPSSRRASSVDGDTSNSITSFYDEMTATFIPNYGFTSIDAPDGSYSAFSSKTYDNGEWVVNYHYENIVDLANLTAVGKSFGSDWASGLWVPYDSIASSLNEDLRILDQTGYGWDAVDSTYSIFQYRRANIYNVNGLLEQRFSYNEANDLTDQTDYFYSTITVVDTDEPITDFALNLQYPNPATNSDQVQILANGNYLNEKYQAQIFNQQGQLMTQQQVRIGDHIGLNELQANGLYFIVINDGTERRAWKVMIAN